MATKTYHSAFSISIIIVFMVLTLPVAQSSRTRTPLTRARLEEKGGSTTKELQTEVVMERYGYGGSIVSVERRQVPTGPDPLHHHDYTTNP